jgi:two-component system, NarL family, captular synthesis response regulator RcsB
MKKRVLIADDHPLILAGVRMLLEARTDIKVAAEASSPDALLQALKAESFDLLITDFSMPGGDAADGLGLLRRVRRDFPDLAVVVLTMISNSGVHGSIVQQGVRGLIDKSSGMAEVSMAIDAVSGGRNYISASFRQGLLESGFDAKAGEPARLSPRELEVVRLFASGMTVTAVSEHLSRSVKTVSRQKADAMVKLGLKSDLEIFVYAREHGMIS